LTPTSCLRHPLQDSSLRRSHSDNIISTSALIYPLAVAATPAPAITTSASESRLVLRLSALHPVLSLQNDAPKPWALHLPSPSFAYSSIACQIPRQDLVLPQAPNLPSSTSYVALSTQRCVDILGVLPTHPCLSIYISDTSHWPLRTPMPGVRKYITHSGCLRPRIRIAASWSLARRGPSTLALCFAFIPPPPHSTSLRIDSVFSTEPSTQVYTRASSAHNPPSRAVHADRGGHGWRFASPACNILTNVRARGGSASTLRVPRCVCVK
jgi:hypothetical protein